MAEPLQRALVKRLSGTFESKLVRVVSSVQELTAATRDSAVAFLDTAALAEVAAATRGPISVPTIAIVEEDPRRAAVACLQKYPGLMHVIGASMLEQEVASEHIANVMRTLQTTTTPRLLDWMDDSVRGRRTRLTHSSKRIERLERMGEFLTTNGVGDRTVEHLRDVAEELLTNAFYDAPVAAGVIKRPISRTEDVALPAERACDIAYGCRDDLAMVRVRDPFGSLTHARVLEVLGRCASTAMDVKVDESMGGAGLGLWRIVSVASFLGICVVKGQCTEFLVGVLTKRSVAAKPFALHLFFREGPKRRFWRFVDEDSSKGPSLNKSVTIVAK